MAPANAAIIGKVSDAVAVLDVSSVRKITSKVTTAMMKRILLPCKIDS